MASDPVAAWRAENAAVTETAPTFDAVTFQPKSLACLVKVSLELLQDSVNVEEALTNALVRSLAVTLDQACLFGDGTGNAPVGLFSTTGISTVSMGTNGASADYDAFVDALYELEQANAGPAAAAIVNPRTPQDPAQAEGQPGALP